jgi:periplasmic copper chaperone A
MKNTSRFIAAIALLAGAASSSSHVVLDEPVAQAGGSYKAVLRVGHGCAGSPTNAIKVQIPAGLRGAPPMPKAGGVVATRLEKLAQPYVNHGKQITEDVAEISWTAASRESWLPDAFFDEFVLRGTVPERPGVLWFKVLQTCENGSNDWSEIPTAGVSTQGMKSPAVLLKVLPAGSAVHQH